MNQLYEYMKKTFWKYKACVWNFNFFYFIKQKINNNTVIKIIEILLIPLGILKDIFISLNFRNEKNIVFKDYLSVVAIVKNEALYIEEWIEYHKLLGITRFYIYDNESTDGLKRVLNKYICNGEVIYKSYPGKTMQCFAYNDVINQYKYKTKYMAFIDIDEFIVVNSEGGVGR